MGAGYRQIFGIGLQALANSLALPVIEFLGFWLGATQLGAFPSELCSNVQLALVTT
jgi:hypothetical protein